MKRVAILENTKRSVAIIEFFTTYNIYISTLF